MKVKVTGMVLKHHYPQRRFDGPIGGPECTWCKGEKRVWREAVDIGDEMYDRPAGWVPCACTWPVKKDAFDGGE